MALVRAVICIHVHPLKAPTIRSIYGSSLDPWSLSAWLTSEHLLKKACEPQYFKDSRNPNSYGSERQPEDSLAI